MLCGIATLFLAAPAVVLPAEIDPANRASSVRVELIDRGPDLKALRESGIDIEAAFDGWARVHVTPEEAEKLTRMGFTTSALPDEGLLGLARLKEEGVARVGTRASVPQQYHDYTTLTQDLQTIAANYPDITRLSSVGQSVQGRELWMMKISRNPDLEEDEPELAYIAAMHGDEVVGKELCFNLINYLTTRYATDARVAQLIDSTEIWILPSMNPDGTEAGTRSNAGGVNLNRNFPDWFSDPVNTGAGRAPETQAVMAWTEAHNPVLSANFHGGALVANYPWDNNPTGSSVNSPTPDPDDAALYSISLTYAENNPPMYNSPSFTDGVTNGAAWYAIDGGMQDWNYGWYGSFQVTMEVSNDKWPAGSTLPQFWEENLESMLSYFERAYEGVRGVVTDAESGAPLAAEVFIDADPFASYTDPDVGDYHRIVLPGSYTLTISAPGYQTSVSPIVVSSGTAARYDVALQPRPTDLQPVANSVDDGPSGNGWIDPGETIDLAVTLTNLGRSATAVEATLVPAGWFTEILTAEADCPDIPTAGSEECNSPGFNVRVDDDVPPGYTPGFAIRWTAAEGSGLSEPFFLEVGEPICGAAAATDVPQSILDHQTTTSTALVSSSDQIANLSVAVDITHTYIGDLIVELISPAGTRVKLHDRSGGSSSNIVGTYGDDLTPAESLATFGGEAASGTWTLSVADQAGGDQGTLNDWSVELCGTPVASSTPEMRFSELKFDPTGVHVSWWPYPGMTSYRIYRSTDPSSPGSFLDVTAEDGNDSDTAFLDTSTGALTFWLVTGVGDSGEGPLGHFDR
ncbi:MAG: hypothetical protein GY716_01495 [bacterium]|nr:hypothetical protein [bacterium]